MPSSNKTPNILLNQWLGSDKPKKDDFNYDNERLDAAVGDVKSTLNAHAQNTGIHVAAAEKTQWNSHPLDAGIHVTGAEKAQWNSGTAKIFTYAGDGNSTKEIALGFRPRFGWLFAAGQPPVQDDWSVNSTQVFSGFFSADGCGKFIELTANGIKVSHNATVPAGGTALRYNLSGTTYVVVAWG